MGDHLWCGQTLVIRSQERSWPTTLAADISGKDGAGGGFMRIHAMTDRIDLSRISICVVS